MTPPRRMPRLATLLLVLVALPARDAAAFVRTKTLRLPAQPMFWSHRCLTLEVHAETTPPETPPALLRGVLDAAAAAWTTGAASCNSQIVTVVNPAPADVVPATLLDPGPQLLGRDDHNSVFFVRGPEWCRTYDGVRVCRGRDTLALTTVWAVVSTGEIRDVDTEINAVHHSWGDRVTGTGGTQDLQNTLTHELGHSLGMDHTCRTPEERAALATLLATRLKMPIDEATFARYDVDDQGVQVPLCDAASPAQRATTMAPTAVAGDVEKRSLAADDAAAVCTVYPATPARACERVEPDDGGCTMASRRPERDSRVCLMLFAAWAAWRCRRARRVARRCA